MTARLDILLRHWPLGLLAVITISVWGCSRPGLVRETYPADFYEIPNLLESNELDDNPVFILYGDNRTGWRAQRLASRFNQTAENLDFTFSTLKNIIHENENNPQHMVFRLKEELGKIKTSANK